MLNPSVPDVSLRVHLFVYYVVMLIPVSLFSNQILVVESSLKLVFGFTGLLRNLNFKPS